VVPGAAIRVQQASDFGIINPDGTAAREHAIREAGRSSSARRNIRSRL